LFEAVAGLAAGGCDARILVAGAGWSYRLRSVASDFGVADRAIFTGFRGDVPELMNICDVVVNPSSDPEPFGRTVIEAMACGKAVVATDMGGHREIIEDGVDGLLAPASPWVFADALRRVLGDTDLSVAMGAAGRRKVLERFSVTRQIDEISALYGELV
ncbi:MAG: glycosyltransferase family 4 protein, partial [Endomicrobiia bacterium]|nr:glycosyltransferase family 4 protein [Endomicrobiia bacterium]